MGNWAGIAQRDWCLELKELQAIVDVDGIEFIVVGEGTRTHSLQTRLDGMCKGHKAHTHAHEANKMGRGWWWWYGDHTRTHTPRTAGNRESSSTEQN